MSTPLFDAAMIDAGQDLSIVQPIVMAGADVVMGAVDMGHAMFALSRAYDAAGQVTKADAIRNLSDRLSLILRDVRTVRLS